MASKVRYLKEFSNWKFRNIFLLSNFSQKATSKCSVRHRITTASSAERLYINVESGHINHEDLKKVEKLIAGNLLVYDDFISQDEEAMLYEELKPSLEGKSYQNEHWDDAIHGYRESEKENWSKSSMMVFKRMRDTAFGSTNALLPYVHVLDLDSNGFIKPHIDSVKFCGPTIAGVSLLSPSIMRFRHERFTSVTIDALLSQRSMYVCRVFLNGESSEVAANIAECAKRWLIDSGKELVREEMANARYHKECHIGGFHGCHAGGLTTKEYH